MTSARRSSIVSEIALRAMLVALLAVGALYASTQAVLDTIRRQTLAADVDTDLAGLADIHSTSGRVELARRIGDRLALQRLGRERVHYILADHGNRRLAGDLASFPALSAARSTAGAVLVNGRPGYGRATRLAADLDLAVVHEAIDESAATRRVAIAFVAAGFAIVLVVGVLAWASSRRLAARVDRINQAFREPAETIPTRAPIDAHHDEIGELARHSVATLRRLSHLVDVQRHVTDNVAHELRTPLMHLDQRLVGLLKNDPDAATAAALTRARADLRGIVRMLDSLLDIAASEVRRGDFAGLEEVNLSTLIGDVVDLYDSSLEEAGLRLVQNVAPGVTMKGEPMELTRLLSNLLDNAIKYVPAGGTVMIELTAGGTLRVADDGPGITAESRATIFDRFRRGGRPGVAGHGLGLALARAIAERHGMSMTLEDTAIGSSFVLAPGDAV